MVVEGADRGGVAGAFGSAMLSCATWKPFGPIIEE
jgi:hypothetical protein